MDLEAHLSPSNNSRKKVTFIHLPKKNELTHFTVFDIMVVFGYFGLRVKFVYSSSSGQKVLALNIWILGLNLSLMSCLPSPSICPAPCLVPPRWRMMASASTGPRVVAHVVIPVHRVFVSFASSSTSLSLSRLSHGGGLP